MPNRSTTDFSLSKTARASMRSERIPGTRVEHVLVVEMYRKPTGAYGLRRWTERREVAL